MASILSMFHKKNKKEKQALVNANSRAAFNTTSFREQAAQMKSPYSVVTEPKKNRGPSSCPGGGNFRPSNRVGSTYENLSNHQNAHRPHSLVRGRKVDEFDRLLRPHPPSRHYYDTRQQSLEYGSGENPVENYRKNRRHQSFESSEGDSDSDASLDDFYRTKYRMDLKNIRRKYKKIARDSYNQFKQCKNQCEHLKAENFNLRMNFERLMSAYEELRVRNAILEASRQNSATPSDPCSVNGAREALCSMSEISGPTAPLSRLPTAFDANGNEEFNGSDEVKVFRDNEEERVEEARRESNSPLDAHTHFEVPNLLPLKLEDDGYSTLNNILEQQNKLHERNQTVRFDGAAEEESSEDEFEEVIQAVRNEALLAPIAEAPFAAPLKRSWSEPTLNSTRAENESVKLVVVSPRRSHRNSRKEECSSYSSDDETVRLIIERQLTRKGDLVQYKPRRENFTSLSRKIYRRFGPNERKALAQFDYLQGLSSTDGSGIEYEEHQGCST